MKQVTFSDIRRLATLYVQASRLVEPQFSRSLGVIGRHSAEDPSPVNEEALSIVTDIERLVPDLLKRGRRLGVGRGLDGRIPEPVRLAEAGRRLGVSRQRVLELIEAGRLSTVDVDGRRMVLSCDVEDLRRELRVS